MPLLAAVQFLTRLPIRLRRAPDSAAIVAWFPFVGVLIGAACGGLGAAASQWVTMPVAATLVVIAGLLTTGAFHEDGLADCADAFGGGYTVERRMEILKDPRHGTYGVAALSSTIILRILCLASVSSPAALFGLSVAANGLGRAAAVGVAAAGPMSRHPGLGADAGRGTTPLRAGAGIGVGLVVVGAAVGWWLAPLVGASVLAALATRALAIRKIGGVSGDVLGAVEQVAECAVLVVGVGLAVRSTLWWA